jgi:hypothetical protein
MAEEGKIIATIAENHKEEGNKPVICDKYIIHNAIQEGYSIEQIKSIIFSHPDPNDCIFISSFMTCSNDGIFQRRYAANS